MANNNINPRVFPYIVYPNSPVLADQVYSDTKISFGDQRMEGSPFPIYDYTGAIRRDLPLVNYPPLGKVFPGTKGIVVPSNYAPSLYNPRKPQK